MLSSAPAFSSSFSFSPVFFLLTSVTSFDEMDEDEAATIAAVVSVVFVDCVEPANNEAKSVKLDVAVVFTVNADSNAESTGSIQDGQVKERSSQSE